MNLKFPSLDNILLPTGFTCLSGPLWLGSRRRSDQRQWQQRRRHPRGPKLSKLLVQDARRRREGPELRREISHDCLIWGESFKLTLRAWNSCWANKSNRQYPTNEPGLFYDSPLQLNTASQSRNIKPSIITEKAGLVSIVRLKSKSGA